MSNLLDPAQEVIRLRHLLQLSTAALEDAQRREARLTTLLCDSTDTIVMLRSQLDTARAGLAELAPGRYWPTNPEAALTPPPAPSRPLEPITTR